MGKGKMTTKTKSKGGVTKGGVKKYGTSSKGGVNKGGVRKSTPKKPTSSRGGDRNSSAAPGSKPRNFNAEGVGARNKKNMRQNQGRAGAGINVDEGAPRGGAAILARDRGNKDKKDAVVNDPYLALKENAGVFSLNN